MKTYELQSKVPYWLHALVGPCIGLLIGVGWIAMAVSQPHPKPADKAGVVFGLLCLGWFVWSVGPNYLKIPHTIELIDDHAIRFIGLFRDTTIAPSDVLSFAAFAGQFAYLKHTHGKILLLPQFTGFHEFLTALKAANPNVAIRGL